MTNLHTHTQHALISGSFGVVKFCSLRGKGRRGWEGRLKNGVRMELYDYIRLDFVFVEYNILVIYNYFVQKMTLCDSPSFYLV